MECHRDTDLPEAVYHLLDFFDNAKPADILHYHHVVSSALQDAKEETRERYQVFRTALEVYPEDNRETPDAAVGLYRTFAESADPADRQLVSGHFDRLWACTAGGALALTLQLWTDPSYRVYDNVRQAAVWAFKQGILDEETWRELCKVVPLAHWKKSGGETTA